MSVPHPTWGGSELYSYRYRCHLNQHGSAIYLGSKSYFVVIISSDIVTEHWCQVCDLSMMSLPLRLPAVC